MQRYWWPDFEKHLLDELQRQQNNVQFCDTLLQTEGISVPTHSCVLAALSPYLSEKLSASPSPPAGQKYHLRLHAVKAKTLLKLVSLLYSGTTCVRGSIEQKDVLALARRFGITGLEEGQKDGPIRKEDCSSLRVSGLGDRRAEVDETKDRGPSGTQTDEDDGRPLHSSGGHSAPVSTAPPGLGPCLDHRTGPSAGLQSQPLTSDESISSNWSCAPPDTDTRAANPEETPTNTVPTETDPTSGQGSLGQSTIAVPLSSSGDQDDVFFCRPQSSEPENRPRGVDEDGTGVEIGGKNGETTEDGEDGGQQIQEVQSWGEELDRSDVNVGMKNKRSHDTKQSTVKVKLRRRTKTKRESWEVVGIPDTDGLTPGGPNTDFTEVQSSPSTDQTMVRESTSGRRTSSDPQTPSGDFLPLDLNPPDSSGGLPPSPTAHTNPDQHLDSQCCQRSTNNFPKSSDAQATSSDSPTPDQSTALEASPPLQNQDSVGESGEQMEKLLEDVMMSLQLLPDLEENPTMHHHGQPTVCQDPATPQDPGPSPTQGPAGAGSGQSPGTRIHNTVTETGVQSGSTEENLRPVPGLSSVLPEATVIQQQQQHHHHHHHHHLQTDCFQSSSWRMNVLRRQDTCSDGSDPFFCPDQPTPRSVLPSTFSSTGQKTRYPEFPGISLQPNIVFLPLKNGQQPEYLHNLPLLCMTDTRPPLCLSPLPLCTSFTDPPTLLRHDWLREKPASAPLPWTIISTTPKSAPPGAAPSLTTKRPRVHNEEGAHKRRKPDLTTHPPDGGISPVTHTSVEVCDLSQSEQITDRGDGTTLSNNRVPTSTRRTANCPQTTRRSVATAGRCRVRTRSYLKRTKKPGEGDASVASQKDVPVERNDESDICVDDNIPEVREHRNASRSRASILKEFQKFIKMRHSKTRNSKKRRRSNQTERRADAEETTFNGSADRLQLDHVAAAGSQRRRTGSGTAVDESHNRTSDQSVVKNRQEDRGGCHGDAPQVTTGTRTETELQPKNYKTNSDAGQGQSPDDDPLRPAGLRKTRCSVDGEGEEAEEEEDVEEVDVLTFSPVRLQSRVEALLSSEIVPDEVDDVDEVDVTGDDTD